MLEDDDFFGDDSTDHLPRWLLWATIIVALGATVGFPLLLFLVR